MTALTAAIIEMIENLGWDTRQERGFPLFKGPYIQPSPDRAVHVTGAGGPGYVTDEGSADAANFQIRVRGPANAPDLAEEAAHKLDLLILTAGFPVMVGGVKIQHMHRLGGRPTPLPVQPGDLRHEFSAVYTAIVGVL